LTEKNARRIWDEVLAGMGDMTAEFASRYSRIAISAPNTLEITFSSKYTSSKSFCERPDRLRQLEEAVKAAVGGPVRLVFQLEAAPAAAPDRSPVRQSQRDLVRQAASNPIVRQAMELFDAHVNRVDPPRNPPPDAE
jgi:DNA polymerase-3 subunit gamma/tau